ncbi:MAG TPA: HAMP domain-containing sensor histidine kinase, partial [Burkholderiales bacterium]
YDLNPIAGTGSARLANAVPDELVVHADAALLTRIFQNLIANAIVHAPQGEIEIGAEEAADGTVTCRVTDNGTGIEPERLESIFEKFETDGKGEDASGLGLAIVKTFVEAHGGTISVESQVGAGSTFRFTLPARKT